MSEKKYALITGANKGIGFAAARLIARMVLEADQGWNGGFFDENGAVPW